MYVFEHLDHLSRSLNIPFDSLFNGNPVFEPKPKLLHNLYIFLLFISWVILEIPILLE